MNELIKAINKKLYILSFSISTIYFLCEFGMSFALAYFATSPFTVDKVTNLTITLGILYVIMIACNWIYTYIANGLFYSTTEINVQKYYFKKVQKMTSKNMINTHTGYIYNLIKYQVSN